MSWLLIWVWALLFHQRCIDWNRDILKKELGLSEKDIIDLPALFKIDREGKAMAYFPNMVRVGPALLHPAAPCKNLGLGETSSFSLGWIFLLQNIVCIRTTQTPGS